MGKGIDSLKLKKRSEKLSFMEVKPTTGSGESTFVRLEGFTTQTFNANAKEFTRDYVDEDTSRTDVTGYAESINYNFDQYVGQKALEEIVKISEKELTGTDAVRKIVTVDMTTLNGSSGKVPSFTANATVRSYAIVPSSNGESTDCMTYSGDFKSRGAKIACTVLLDNDFQTLTITGSETAAEVTK